MSLPIEIQNCQEFLDKFGAIPDGYRDSSKHMFRIVWAEDQLEVRIGEFNEYAGGLFLRTFVGQKEIKKYWFLPSTWVLEQWFPPEKVLSSELPDSVNGSYEPFYVFADNRGKVLPFNFKVVEILMLYKMKPAASNAARKSFYRHLEEDKERSLDNYFMDVVEDPGNGQVGEADLVHEGHGIFMPSNFERKIFG